MPKEIESPNELVKFWNDLVDVDKETRENPLPNKLPIDPPKYLVHCSNLPNFMSILEDDQFGGKEVLSGNVHSIFKETHFSPIPHLHYGGYDACIVLDTDKHPDIYPTYYEERLKKDKCSVFNDDGWNLIAKSEIKERCDGFSKREHEWNIKNPYKFQFDDIEFIVFRNDSSPEFQKHHQNNIRYRLEQLASKKKMSFGRFKHTLMEKAILVSYDYKTGKFSDEKMVFTEKYKKMLEEND